MLIPGVIGVVKPGPPRWKKSPLHEVRRMISYKSRSATNPMKPPVTAAPAAPLVPAAIGCGTGGSTGIANALFGIPAVNIKALTAAARVNLFILSSLKSYIIAIDTVLICAWRAGPLSKLTK